MTGSTENGREPLRPMSDEKIVAAALSDPDALPLLASDFERMKPVPRVRIVRRALGLSQQEFAARYRIPVGTLRDWDEGRSVPDQVARTYLEVIASEPEAVARALHREGGA